MFVKLLVILAFISFGNLLADDGLLNSVYSDDDDGEIMAPEEVLDAHEKTEREGEVGDTEEGDETISPEDKKTIGSEQTKVSQEEKNEDKGNTSATNNFEGNTSATSNSNDSGWDCVAYSDNIVQCTSSKMIVGVFGKAPSPEGAGAGIPTSPPKGVAEPQKKVHIKGPLQAWFDDFFGAISKIHDKIKESIQLPLKKILGD